MLLILEKKIGFSKQKIGNNFYEKKNDETMEFLYLKKNFAIFDLDFEKNWLNFFLG